MNQYTPLLKFPLGRLYLAHIVGQPTMGRVQAKSGEKGKLGYIEGWVVLPRFGDLGGITKRDVVFWRCEGNACYYYMHHAIYLRVFEV